MKTSRPLSILILIVALAVLAAGGGYAWLFGDLPAVETVPEGLNLPSVRITDRNGALLYEALPADGGRHTPMAVDAIPLALKQATVATEDSRFYTNPGVDLLAILRSMVTNVLGGETLGGGSTITQQVARNLLLGVDERSERTVRRKLRESLLAWRLARRYSKDEILGLYLNQMNYGGLAYGVQAAAQTYFGKPVSELDLAECTLLAGLPQAPALYNPFTDMEAAKARQAVVLERMLAEGYLTPAEKELAFREPLILARTPYPMEAPHFVMWVRAQLDGLFTPEQIRQQGGLVVRTSLDLNWQHHAEQAIQRHLENLRDSEDGLGHNVNSAALVALDPHSGQVLAMVGSPDYFDDQHGGAINMALAPLQPGSALKPLVYAAALDPTRPNPWTAATLLLDVRTSFTTHEGQAYTPANYDGREHGPVLVREALASSLNIPAVLALDHVGLKALFELGRHLGLTTLNDPDRSDLSVALGGGQVRLLELSAAYGAFSNGGYRVQPASILEVSSPIGEVLYQVKEPQPERVLDERVAWLVSDILSDNQARTLGFGPNSTLRLDRPAAVKTGTTTNFHDNWTVGYTPELVVGVWVGNTDHEPMQDVTGLTGAAPIWHQFLRTVLSGRPKTEFARPAGLVQLEVCALSGLLPTPQCPYHRLEWFIDGTQPTQADGFYRQVRIDRQNGRLAAAGTPAEETQTQVVLDLPPQAHPWARAQGLPLYADLQPAFEERPGGPVAEAGLSLVAPANQSVYRLSATLTDSAQRIRIQAVADAGLVAVSLWVDGVQVGSFPDGGPYQVWWQLTPGEHQAWAEAQGADGGVVKSEAVHFKVE